MRGRVVREGMGSEGESRRTERRGSREMKVSRGGEVGDGK